MFKVGIIGPESTGKSTLAAYLASRYDALLIKEYARAYVEQLDRPYTREDVETIARHQIAEMKDLIARYDNQDKVVIFDTELIITKVWMDYAYGECPDWLEEALEAYPMDVYLLTTPDIDWVEDPVRENPDIREELFERYEREIQKLCIPYYVVRHAQE